MKFTLLISEIFPFIHLLVVSVVEGQLHRPVSLPLVSLQTGDDFAGKCPSTTITPNTANQRLIISELVRDVVTNIVPQCGEGLWYRVAYLNMSDPSQRCPSNWIVYNISNGARVCRRRNTTNGSCSSTFYPTGRQYRRVCGRVIGYQFARPDAFTTPNGYLNPGKRDVSIDGSYVDGVSITHGLPSKQHIWTYAGGLTEHSTQPWNSVYNCPCTNDYTGPGTQSFVGSNYYCESANSNDGFSNDIYLGDKLWDGKQCAREGECCSSTGRSPPWFSVELSSLTNDDIEVRICGDEGTSNEGTPVELVEIHVQ